MSKDGDEGGCVKLTLADLVFSALPWPLHKDLPANYCGKEPGDKFPDLVRLVLRPPSADEPGDKIKRGN